MEFVWEEVLGATDYLLRLPETTFLWENSLLGNGNKTSVEIPYSSLPFKRDTEKIPLKVVIEVWAYGNSKIIGNGRRYTNVGMYESYTGLSSKRKISLFYWGKNLCLYLTSILFCCRCLRVFKHQLHFVLEVCKYFPVSALLSGPAVIANLPEGDSCYLYIYFFTSHKGNNERNTLLTRITK